MHKFTQLLCLLLLMAVANLISCSKVEDPFKPLYFEKKSESAHFAFYYDDGLTAAQVQPIEQALEENYDRIISHLDPGPVSKTRIAIWSDKEQWEKDMSNQYPGAAGYIMGKEEVRLHYYESPGMLRGAVHEFVHVVSLYLLANSANNPRWLWEAVAQYESGSWTDLKTLPYLVAGEYPTLDDLSDEQGVATQKIYPLGFSLGEFIVEKWDYTGLRALIRSHGNIQESLGISQQEFEKQWQMFVEERYLK